MATKKAKKAKLGTTHGELLKEFRSFKKWIEDEFHNLNERVSNLEESIPAPEHAEQEELPLNQEQETA
jgi:hypothetical protein